MQLILESTDIKEYLKDSNIIDYENESIREIAHNLSEAAENEVELARRVYEHVRDDISHSNDINGQVITCNASEVLMHKQGICYAKSHLLAAILRKLGIPAGFCYQRLLNDEENPRLVLHGLNAIYLESVGRWIRVDARGNKPGIQAEFSLEEEKLAYHVREELGETDIPIIFSTPNKNIINALKRSMTVDGLIDNLPSDL